MSNSLTINDRSRYKTARACRELLDHAALNPSARILIACAGKLHPLMESTIAYIKHLYPGVTVTIEDVRDRKDRAQGIAGHVFTDSFQDSA